MSSEDFTGEALFLLIAVDTSKGGDDLLSVTTYFDAGADVAVGSSLFLSLVGASPSLVNKKSWAKLLLLRRLARRKRQHQGHEVEARIEMKIGT